MTLGDRDPILCPRESSARVGARRLGRAVGVAHFEAGPCRGSSSPGVRRRRSESSRGEHLARVLEAFPTVRQSWRNRLHRRPRRERSTATRPARLIAGGAPVDTPRANPVRSLELSGDAVQGDSARARRFSAYVCRVLCVPRLRCPPSSTAPSSPARMRAKRRSRARRLSRGHISETTLARGSLHPARPCGAQRLIQRLDAVRPAWRRSVSRTVSTRCARLPSAPSPPGAHERA